MAGDVGDEGEAPVTTSAVRAAILVGAVVIGAVLIANAFPSGGAPGPVGSPSNSPTSSPTTSPTPHPQKLDCSTVKGTRVAVENASGVTGLAAATANKVKHAGFTVNGTTDIGTASSQASTTTVYFHGTDNKTAAKCLRKDLFHGAAIRML